MGRLPRKSSGDTPTRLHVGRVAALGPQKGALVADKYRLARRLARGGMGEVWEAWDAQLERPVAIKFMDFEIAGNAMLRQRFNREAKAAARLRTPYVVQVYEHGVDGDTPYIVMELLEGQDLHRRLRDERRIPMADMVPIVNQVAKALRAAQEAKIIHRDLKPQNVFLAQQDDEMTVKILDFGVAKLTDSQFSGEGTKTGVVVGSPHYMSPEQARGLPSFDHRSDLWSLAVIIFKGVTGHRPFKGQVAGDVIVKICAEPVPKASEVKPGLPSELDDFFAVALDRDPDRRFQTAPELAQAFANTVARIAHSPATQNLPPSPQVTGLSVDSHPGTPASGISHLAGFTPSQPNLQLRDFTPPASYQPGTPASGEVHAPPRVAPSDPYGGTPASGELQAPPSKPSDPYGGTPSSGEMHRAPSSAAAPPSVTPSPGQIQIPSGPATAVAPGTPLSGSALGAGLPTAQPELPKQPVMPEPPPPVRQPLQTSPMGGLVGAPTGLDDDTDLDDEPWASEPRAPEPQAPQPQTPELMAPELMAPASAAPAAPDATEPGTQEPTAPAPPFGQLPGAPEPAAAKAEIPAPSAPPEPAEMEPAEPPPANEQPAGSAEPGAGADATPAAQADTSHRAPPGRLVTPTSSVPPPPVIHPSEDLTEGIMDESSDDDFAEDEPEGRTIRILPEGVAQYAPQGATWKTDYEAKTEEEPAVPSPAEADAASAEIVIGAENLEAVPAPGVSPFMPDEGSAQFGLSDALPAGQLNTDEAVAGATGVHNTALIGGLAAVGTLLLVVIIIAIASSSESTESEPTEALAPGAAPTTGERPEIDHDRGTPKELDRPPSDQTQADAGAKATPSASASASAKAKTKTKTKTKTKRPPRTDPGADWGY